MHFLSFAVQVADVAVGLVVGGGGVEVPGEEVSERLAAALLHDPLDLIDGKTPVIDDDESLEVNVGFEDGAASGGLPGTRFR